MARVLLTVPAFMAVTPLEQEHAARANLNYASADEPGIARRGSGSGFVYVAPGGRRVRDQATLARIRSLAIPPAWKDVWISRDPDGHLQAVGRDARGRKQYRYHPRWRSVRDAAKYDRLVDFCRALPRLRKRVARDLACSCLCRDKVVAVVVSLLERAQLRVGNDEYTRQNGSFGATTLRDRHARIRGAELELRYRGKGGAERRVSLRDRRLASLVRRCRDLPGQRLFQYVDADGSPVPITSSDVNEYLRQVTGGPFTAKDFRTWAATIACAVLLCHEASHASEKARKASVTRVVETVAAQLGNTPTVCRRCYIHPMVIESFMDGRLAEELGPAVRRLGRELRDKARSQTALDAQLLTRVESAVVGFLERPAGAGRRSRLRACARPRAGRKMKNWAA
jgi:DNA topoisomerase-1